MRLAAIMAAAFLTAAPASAQEAEDMDSLPAAEARETVFYACTACHGTRIIRQQGLTRERWEQTIEALSGFQGGEPGLRDGWRRDRLREGVAASNGLVP
jgi:hypothetical protein